MRALLDALPRTITIVLIEHDMDVALAFAERITLLHFGEVIVEGAGLVPQGRRLLPSLSVTENLSVAARRRPDASWTAERVFSTFPRLRDRRVQAAGLLSGSEQRMRAIGRALMGNPRVPLLDELSEGLTPQMVAEIGGVIAALKDEGLSIVLVEQNVRPRRHWPTTWRS